MFLFSVKVIEEVKSDALYEFQPPFNLLAGIVVWPCSLIYSPEVVGKISRILLRVFYFPELVFIYIFEILAVRKKPRHTPMRPGLVGHQQAYDAVPYSSSTSGIPTLGKLTNGKHVEGTGGDGADHVVKASELHPTLEEGVASSSSSTPSPSKSGNGTESSQGHPPAPMPSSSNRRFDPLTTQGLAPTHNQEVLSPYYESIYRFRDSNKGSPTMTRRSSMRDPNDRSQRCATCSCHATMAAPVGMGTYRRLSVVSSYYDRARQGTDATLSGTFQGDIPLESDYDGGDNGGGVSAPPLGGNIARDHAYNQQQGEEARLTETRYEEMQTQMDQIESKLDRLMDAITAITNHQNS